MYLFENGENYILRICIKNSFKISNLNFYESFNEKLIILYNENWLFIY